ncbi:NADP-specific glutamate dehydrogenase [Alloiococcus otitis]|uniref:Glutamate dehydrogenase n=1 Tax=Alloiococcus otitis ATCC 51267 TaxID=883081 RepID=K9EB05_9LACT|nr:NADP-specific glutamate dehydrogenase [Alloiococcus otitis]EKU94399.1 hypothetical protein HMPREF9698_00127 [Alloiococcus otitis ATCC 51267]SUU81271.1 NADP-specific glutamate dehydrogenase [Alloiococcus otitis]
MESSKEYIQQVIDKVKAKHPEKEEFNQAVTDVLTSLEKYLDQHPEVQDHNLLELLVEPERVIKFRVPWQDDQGNWRVNEGLRVQFNSAIGPYKGGIRFDPSVNESVIRFLAFEQIFKNSLTNLPIGGGKGGSDFNPKGKSDNEIMRFCQSFVTELQKYIGPDYDVPAGDVGVSKREISYMYGQYKRLREITPGVYTGKPLTFGGSVGRTEATGYGLVYFVDDLLKDRGDSLEGKRIVVSGSGNVAGHAIKKAQDFGGLVLACSDRGGYLYDPDGIDVDQVIAIKSNPNNTLAEYKRKGGQAKYVQGESVWDLDINYDISLPCATQNEISESQAQNIASSGVFLLAEGANMPVVKDGLEVLLDHDIIVCPGKAANAGGVAVSALEMSQNSQRLSWTFDQVDQNLQVIMQDIYQACSQAAKDYGDDKNLILGANIAGADKVFQAMLAQGLA